MEIWNEKLTRRAVKQQYGESAKSFISFAIAILKSGVVGIDRFQDELNSIIPNLGFSNDIRTFKRITIK